MPKKLPLWAIGTTVVLASAWFWYNQKKSNPNAVYGRLPGQLTPGVYVPNASAGVAAQQTLGTFSQAPGTVYYQAGQDSADGSGGGNMS